MENEFHPQQGPYHDDPFLWGFAPFEKYKENPIMAPGEVDWRERSVYNTTAFVEDDTVYLVYRAEGVSPFPGRDFTSRIGVATSQDGFHFHCEPSPVMEPTEVYEIPGGCEDPRIVKINGSYVLTYTGYDGKVARLCMAFSSDLHHWNKIGPIFPERGWTKSGAIIPIQINGAYWMYFGDSNIWLAYSADLNNWKVIEAPVLLPRKGRFDSHLVEPGPTPLITDDGILFIYNSADEKTRYTVGQALFDLKDPTKLLRRSEKPILEPTTADEMEGQVSNVVFAEGLVHFKNQWLLYYGMADSRIGAATSPTIY